MSSEHATVAVVTFLLVLVLALLFIDTEANGIERPPDTSYPNSPDANDPGYWGDDCIKIDESAGTSWVADADYELVVLKAGTVDYVWFDVSVGDELVVPKDISHFVLCGKVTATTTTGATTSTAPTTTSVSTSTSTAPTTTSASTTTSTAPTTISASTSSSTSLPLATLPPTE